MKEKLIQYVDLLFAGATGSEEIKQEILQNTLDRYDDLIAEGRSPESAYRIAISGIERVYFGAYEPKMGCAGSVYDLPADRALGTCIPCMGGLLEAECAALMRSFFGNKRE